MINILFVSCYSADINNSASIELIYYMNLLARSGKFKVYLLTLDFPKNSIYYDDNLGKMIDPNITIHRVKGGKLLNKLLPKKSHVQGNVSKNNIKIKTLIKIKNKMIIVDPYTSWINRACDYFKNNLTDINFQIILGMHEPPSSLICAYKIKKNASKFNNNIRLVSYFSDPYCNEISRRSRGVMVRSINKSIEKKIIRYSDSLLFVTESNLVYYKSKYSLDENKTGLIHRGFDRELYNKSRNDYPDEFSINMINILHAGDIVKGVRNIKEFVYAIELLKNKYEDLFSDLNINFFGNINDDEQFELIQNSEYIKMNNRISYKDILSFIINADILIVFGNKEFSQIPAKIYDYMGSNAYIFVILESYEDPLYKLVKDVDGVYCSLNVKEDIANTLYNMVMKFSREIKFNRDVFNNDIILSRMLKFLNIQ